MHLKVFVKLKKTLKPPRPGKKTQKNPKKTKKPKKTQKKQKKPLGWVFFKKPGFFPTLITSETDYFKKMHDRPGYTGIP